MWACVVAEHRIGREGSLRITAEHFRFDLIVSWCVVSFISLQEMKWHTKKQLKGGFLIGNKVGMSTLDVNDNHS